MRSDVFGLPPPSLRTVAPIGMLRLLQRQRDGRDTAINSRTDATAQVVLPSNGTDRLERNDGL